MSGTPAAVEPASTEDRLLGGRVRLRQPAEGYRAAIDPVFLAAAVPAEPHQLVLDVGCGAGAAMLCLAARVPHSRVVGLEMQRELVRLAGDNVILNGMEARVSVMIGDLLRAPPRLSPGAFDHVMANPPYNERGHTVPPATPGKDRGDDRGRCRSLRLDQVCAGDGKAQRLGDVYPPRRSDRCLAGRNRRSGRRGRGLSAMGGRRISRRAGS